MKNMTALEFWEKKFKQYPESNSEKLAIVMMNEYTQYLEEEKNNLMQSGWKKLRDEYFNECICTHGDILKKEKIDLAPHDLFQWFKNKITKIS